MADDAKQLQEDLKELERLASKLGKSVNFSNLKNDAEAVKELLKAWKKEVDEINREFSDLSSTFKNVIDDLKNFDSTSVRINRSFKILGGLADKLKYDAEDINKLNKKDLENLQKKAQTEASNLSDQNKILKAKYEGQNLARIERNAQERGLKNTLKEISQYRELQGIFDANNELKNDENNYIKKLLDLTTARLAEEERVQKQLGLVGVAAKGLVNTLSKFGIDSSYFSDLDKKLEKAARNGEDVFETLGKEIKSNLVEALNDPLVQFAIHFLPY
jgi:chromosome segregation ATPase